MMGLGVHLRSVTISSGQSASAQVNIQGLRLHGVIIGSGWTAAALYFGGSYDGSNIFDVANDSAVYSIATPTVNTLFNLRRQFFEGLTSVSLKSGTPSVAVNQGADRTLYLILSGG